VRKIIIKEIPNIDSMVMAVSIEELTDPLINSKLPMQANPSKVIPVARQITCLVFEFGIFIEPNISTDIPSINIDVLRPAIKVDSHDCTPRSRMKVSVLKSKVKNKYANSADVRILKILKKFKWSFFIIILAFYC
jgi:hypothetical protein